jgi:heme-degrading monooxygenase HmoA
MDATIVVISRFTIANGMTQEVRDAFRSRPHLVDAVPGFVSMEVLSPVGKPEEIWLTTRWADMTSYQDWHHSHEYHQSHSGIPKGLKLDPKATSITCYEIVAR